MKKKVIALLLAVTMLLTSASRFFDVKASAIIEPVTASMIIIGLAVLGFGWAASQFSQVAGSDISDSYESYKNARINREDTMCYDFSTGYWSVNESVVTTSEDKEFYQGIADELNQKQVYLNNVYSSDSPSAHDMFCEAYEKGNQIVADSILSGFIPTLDTTMSGYADFMKLQGGTLRYDMRTGEFGWDIPESSSTLEYLDIDGVLYYSPHSFTRSDGYSISEAEALSWGAQWANRLAVDKYSGRAYKNCYGWGQYIIYNDKIYYYCPTWATSSREFDVYLSPFAKIYSYYSSDGRACPASSYDGCVMGNFYFTKPMSENPFDFANHPVADFNDFSVDDFNNSTSADYITLTSDKTHDNISTAADLGLLSEAPVLTIGSDGDIAAVDGINTDSLNDNIRTIARAQELGLISDNPEITTDAEGNITAVDGIDIKQLEKLVDDIGEEGLSFEDFEEYYKQIVKLLQASNTDTASMKSILNNIRSKEQSIGADISKINSAVKSIAEAITAEVEIEDEAVKTDMYYTIVEHTGLAEAETIANGIPIVGQVKTLLNNILSGGNYNGSAPNFYFYWDSNGDGLQEQYCALDLSFLETRLTNDNLDDKNRFQKSMTVREFIQSLLIFICYISFAVKIIKKLPSLIGGSDGFDGDINTVNGSAMADKKR